MLEKIWKMDVSLKNSLLSRGGEDDRVFFAGFVLERSKEVFVVLGEVVDEVDLMVTGGDGGEVSQEEVCDPRVAMRRGGNVARHQLDVEGRYK
jgi:hypothetical protein